MVDRNKLAVVLGVVILAVGVLLLMPLVGTVGGKAIAIN